MDCLMNQKIKDYLPNPFAVDYQYEDGPLDLYTEKEMLKFGEDIVRRSMGIYHAIDNGNLIEGTDDYLEAIWRAFLQDESKN
jgi:hypothetical protein